ncbi:MAG: hypothetical protein HC851_23305 [Acaryochloris sp. RU_4_1]|nr:hypothetical protein [Acaryochloris sp. RU_4_1]
MVSDRPEVIASPIPKAPEYTPKNKFTPIEANSMIIQIRDFLKTHMTKELTCSSIVFLVIAGSIYGLSAFGVIDGDREAPLETVADVSASIGFTIVATAYVAIFLDLVVKDIQGASKEAPKPEADENC